MIKNYTWEEIQNGSYYFSHARGSTLLEKFKNSQMYHEGVVEWSIVGNGRKFTCLIDCNGSGDEGGYYMWIFNESGDLVENTFPKWDLPDSSLESAQELMVKLGYSKV